MTNNKELRDSYKYIPTSQELETIEESRKDKIAFNPFIAIVAGFFSIAFQLSEPNAKPEERIWMLLVTTSFFFIPYLYNMIRHKWFSNDKLNYTIGEVVDSWIVGKYEANAYHCITIKQPDNTMIKKIEVPNGCDVGKTVIIAYNDKYEVMHIIDKQIQSNYYDKPVQNNEQNNINYYNDKEVQDDLSSFSSWSIISLIISIIFFAIFLLYLTWTFLIFSKENGNYILSLFFSVLFLLSPSIMFFKYHRSFSQTANESKDIKRKGQHYEGIVVYKKEGTRSNVKSYLVEYCLSNGETKRVWAPQMYEDLQNGTKIKCDVYEYKDKVIVCNFRNEN